MNRKPLYVRSFSDVTIDDVPHVGGKNASLGEMIRTLAKRGVRIPDGFIVTADAYRYFIKENKLDALIKKESARLKKGNLPLLADVGKSIRAAIRKAAFPEDLERDIRARYAELEREYKPNVDVAARSSATAEDLPGASFAGQQETYLNVRGADGLLEAVRAAFASLFTDRAISYRHDKGFGHANVALSVGVQKMVRSDRGASGVAFTVDTESGFGNVVLINGALGLGELIVQGEVTPDEWVVFKPTGAIINKNLGKKDKKLVYGVSAGKTTSLKTTKLLKTTDKERMEFCLSEDEVLKLASWCMEIEKHYTERNGRWTPMDIEWAKDGVTDDLYIIQARPETVQSARDFSKVKVYRLKQAAPTPILVGAAVGNKITSGKAHVILDAKHIGEFEAGGVLVTDMTDPDWEPIMKIASAIVTDKGGRTSHAAIVSRELGIPAVVGTERATKVLKTGQVCTVNTTGSEGYVYRGALEFEVVEKDIRESSASLRKRNLQSSPHVKIMMNIATPDSAFEKSFIPNDGVGLAREEFIIASEIGMHPNLLIDYQSGKTWREDRTSLKLHKEIEKRTAGWRNKEQFYVDKLAYGIARIAAAFYPKDVIVRFSDFKTNEYRTLLGGDMYEPEEANPMIGWRGASRYYDKQFADAFGLECRAFKKAREDMGLVNIVPMVPFCRTPEEGRKVIEVMAKHGLERKKETPRQARGDKNLQVFVMCEIPSNILRADEFLDIFDGMSIGSNDLTQLTLGLDRDAGALAHIGNERDAAVKELIRQVIGACRKRRKYVGICGDAPSTFPDFKAFLVREGIESISLNPDAILNDL